MVILSKIWVVSDWQNHRNFADEIKNVMKMKQIMMLLAAMLLTACSKNSEMKAQTMEQKMYITIDGQTQAVTLVDNAATQALVERLKDGAVTVTLNSSGGFEIWGALGFSLPTSNEQINAQPGDVILYNGSNICIFYGTNSWSYTRLGKIDGLLESELRTFLKAGLTPVYADRSTSGRLQGKNTVYFEEAKLVLEIIDGQNTSARRRCLQPFCKIQI